MNRNFFRTLLVLGIIGLFLAGGIAGLWYLFYGRGVGTLPVLKLIQPESSLTIRSGQGLVFIVEGQSAQGLDRIEFFVDGPMEYSAPAFGQSQFQAVFPWFSTILGDHQLSAIGYDRAGRASQPISALMRVQAADMQGMLEEAVPLDPTQNIEEIAAQAGGGNQAGGAPGGNPPVNPAGAGQPGGGQPGIDVQPPVAELVVIPAQQGDAVVATVQALARDNAGLEGMQLFIQSPSGNPEQAEYDCEGNLECRRELERPLAEAGNWMFILNAVDRAGLFAQQQFASVDVVCDQNMICAPAEGNAAPVPFPGEPPQGDGEPPTAILKVTPLRNGDSVAAIVEIHARDNAGLGIMRLEIRSPVGMTEQFAVGCEANLDCDSEFVYPLAKPGQWIFVLHATDLSGQFALPKLAVVQIMCAQDIGCAVAQEDIPQGDLPPAANLDGPGFWWEPGERPVFEPIDAAGGLLCMGVEPPQESFVVGGCAIVLPVDLPGGPFTQCPWDVGSLLNADLRGVDLRQANLFQGDLRGANLTCGADLRGADLRLAMLFDTRIDSSTQMDAKWRLVWELINRGGYLLDLAGVDLSEADLRGVDLFGANLAGADLHGADLGGANLLGANLFDANLAVVTWDATTCPDGSSSDANGDTCEAHIESALPLDESFMLRGCFFVLPVNLPNGPFTDCEHADLLGHDLRQLDLRNARLFDADLTGADLRGADLTGADLRAVRFRGVVMDLSTNIDDKWRLVWSIANRGARGRDLSGVDLSWAALEFSDLSRATLVGVDFSNAVLIGANLSDANLNGVIWRNTVCPDGVLSDNVGGVCVGHLSP